MKNLSPRFVIAIVLLAGTAILLEARSRNEVMPPRQSVDSFPSQLGSWTGRDITIDQQQLDILGDGEFLLRDYTEAGDREPSIGLFLAYFPSQRAGDTIHSPNHCLPGAGWVPVRRETIQLPRPDGSTFPANRYVISKSGNRALVLYWYLAHNREVASEYWAKYYLVADSIRMNRSDGALVRLITDMYPGETLDQAQARIWSLGSQIVPILNNYVPR